MYSGTRPFVTIVALKFLGSIDTIFEKAQCAKYTFVKCQYTYFVKRTSSVYLYKKLEFFSKKD